MSEDLEIYRNLAQEEDVKNLYRFFEKFEEERGRLKEQKERFIKEKIALESELLDIKKEINQKKEELRKLENAKELINEHDEGENDITMPPYLKEVEVYLDGEKRLLKPTKKLYSYKSVKKLSEAVLEQNNATAHTQEDHSHSKSRILELELENAKLSVENRDLKQENARLSRYEDIDLGS